MASLVVGVDVGGTNIKLGLVNFQGRILAKTHFSTRNFVRNKKQLIDVLFSSIRALLSENSLSSQKIAGVGIGLPGLVNAHKGTVLNLTNIPGCKNVPLASVLQKRLRCPVYIDNDVNLMALGEWRFGAGRGCANLFCLTLGTGVGGGIILDNRLYRGEGFSAGELGHVPLNEEGPLCNCGGRACLERYVGNQTLLAKARKIFGNQDISLEVVAESAASGNRRAIRFWEETAAYIGLGLVSVVNLFNPKRIVIGGGVAHNWPFIFKTIKSTLQTRAMKIPAGMAGIFKAKLGDDAGIIGAQVLVAQSMNLFKV